ncbi:MAG: GNAT family N-acetyltransferase [Clostridiales bacterium]|jgi:Acetyltransferases, including N-acetylases of ribosomal proteins|nr:GNAT family N-acetyltransferase [Clostridiales bacterium]
MQYKKEITLKNGMTCLLSTPSADDAADMLRTFLVTHGETEFLSSYPDENTITEESERAFIGQQNAAPRGMLLCAFIDGVIAGTAGFSLIRSYDKMKHRAHFGISVEKAYWGLGIGRALTEACIECARAAGLLQLELEAVSENVRAVRLYESVGFIEYGRNPRAFLTRSGKWQENILMRLEL